jgi:hypothetical protein
LERCGLKTGQAWSSIYGTWLKNRFYGFISSLEKFYDIWKDLGDCHRTIFGDIAPRK